jgi:hypothetical protein
MDFGIVSAKVDEIGYITRVCGEDLPSWKPSHSMMKVGAHIGAFQRFQMRTNFWSRLLRPASAV